MHLISNSISFKIVVTFILITFCSIYSARSDELKLICEGKLESLRFGQVESFEMELTFLTVKGSKLLDYEIYASNAYLMDKGFARKSDTNYIFQTGRLAFYALDRRSGSIVEDFGTSFDELRRQSSGENKYLRFRQTKCKKAEVKF